jgi:site-specific recombinase XerD
VKIDLSVEELPDYVDLVLVMGLPGSGKTVIAKKLASEKGLIHIEADQFFIDNDTGEYTFDHSLLETAHKWCLAETKRLLDEGQRVVVANTFGTTKSRKSYFKLGHRVAVHTATGQYKSIHDLSHDIVERMRECWQPYHMSEYSANLEPKIKNDLRYIWPVTVQWGKLLGGYKSPIFFDGKLRIIEPFTRYCLDIAKINSRFKRRGQAHKSEINNASIALKYLAEFMRTLRLEWNQVDDGYLEQFRTWYLEKIEQSSQTRNKLSRMRTVNIRLREIYNFYHWAQEEACLVENYIGWELQSKIRSKLPSYIKDGQSALPRVGKGNLLYPKLFPNAGSSSDVIDYTASDRDKEKLKEFFETQGGSDYSQRRNMLIMEIAASVGWRQGSINSLLIDAFSDEKIEGCDTDFLTVQPPEQKYGYLFEFEVPLALALRINRYINSDRVNFLASKKLNEDTAEHHLFVSAITGKPLAVNSITEIFSRAFTAIGAPQGAGVHSFRRSFTTNEIRFQIDSRKRKNLSTAPEDVMLPVQRALGHKSPLSQQSYADASQSLTRDTVERELRDENLQLRAELAEKEREMLILVKSLAKARTH